MKPFSMTLSYNAFFGSKFVKICNSSLSWASKTASKPSCRGVYTKVILCLGKKLSITGFEVQKKTPLCKVWYNSH